MEQLNLEVESRTTSGKCENRRTRRAGKLPGILYGTGKPATSITVSPTLIQSLLLREGGRNQILNLKGGGLDGRHALIKEYQIDPVKRTLLHVDLLEIDIKQKINVVVPINLVGKAAGVADGGVVNFIERSVEIRCVPTSIPKHIDVDVTALKIGDSIHFNDVQLPEGVERVNQSNPTLVAVVPPTKEEEAAPSLAPTAEPEVITAKKDAAEGEAKEGAAAAGGGDKKDEKKK